MRTTSARKGRSNKIYTARGPRDRRIRLSADIAIQFYDVQDRLGYDRATEAVDWLISKAKGSIDKLFDNSFQQQSKHLTHLGAQNSFYQSEYYLTESMSGREDSGAKVDPLPESISSRDDYGAPNLHNSYDNISMYNCTMDSSMILPCIQMENSSENFAHPTISTPLGLQHSSLPSFQQMEKNGQNSRMVMFNSKFTSKYGEHPFISNSEPLFFQAPNNESSSSFHTPISDPELNLCLPGYCTSTFSDSEQWSIF
ncbi:transcription factor TCP24-like [Chenopodium quinoa]|uniref:transcription factor TCP24-like n=1 Tax=Chenopodium quinoa TaxID=63459 RepID=UPI000B7916F0|nr:transcription factor TCP24-like [Chenopodium quinoa]